MSTWEFYFLFTIVAALCLLLPKIPALIKDRREHRQTLTPIAEEFPPVQPTPTKPTPTPVTRADTAQSDLRAIRNATQKQPTPPATPTPTTAAPNASLVYQLTVPNTPLSSGLQTISPNRVMRIHTMWFESKFSQFTNPHPQIQVSERIITITAIPGQQEAVEGIIWERRNHFKGLEFQVSCNFKNQPV
jgi:hypothetical protein